MKNKVLLIGGFRKTKTLAKSLLKKGYKVTIINNDSEHCLRFSEIEGLMVFNGDGTLPSMLLNAGASSCNIAIALTSKDEDNLAACQLCKNRFGVKKTISLVGNPNKTDFFLKMGVDSVICAIERITDIIEQQAIIDKIANSFAVGEGKISITELKIRSNYPVVNRMLKNISLPKHIIIGCILRKGNTMIPRGETTILTNDILIVIAEAGTEEKSLKVLTGAN